MTAPHYYLVVNEQAFALEDDGMTVFGAPVNADGNVDWDDAYYFDSYDEDIEYIAHMSNLLVQSAKLYHEHNVEVFTK